MRMLGGGHCRAALASRRFRPGLASSRFGARARAILWAPRPARAARSAGPQAGRTPLSADLWPLVARADAAAERGRGGDRRLPAVSPAQGRRKAIAGCNATATFVLANAAGLISKSSPAARANLLDPELRLQNRVHRRRIGLAAKLAHHLADEPADSLRAGLHRLGPCQDGGDDRLDRRLQRARCR